MRSFRRVSPLALLLTGLGACASLDAARESFCQAHPAVCSPDAGPQGSGGGSSALGGGGTGGNTDGGTDAGTGGGVVGLGGRCAHDGIRSITHYTTGHLPTAAAIGDVDGDGWPDVVVASKGGVQVFTGNQGVLTLAAFAAPGPATGVALGHLLSANLDIAFNAVTQIGVLRNDGSLSFTPVYLDAGVTFDGAIALGDFDITGTDSIVCGNSANGIIIFPNQGGGVVGTPIFSGEERAFFVQPGAFFNDPTSLGLVEVPAPDAGDMEFPHVLRYSGGGYLVPVYEGDAAQTPLSSPAVADFDHDGNLDLAGIYLQKLPVLMGDGTGNMTLLTTLTTGAQASLVFAADLDGDGNADLIVPGTATGGTLGFFAGNGDGGFAAEQLLFSEGQQPTSLALGDLDLNGQLDVVLVDTFNDNVGVLLNPCDVPDAGLMPACQPVGQPCGGLVLCCSLGLCTGLCP